MVVVFLCNRILSLSGLHVIDHSSAASPVQGDRSWGDFEVNDRGPAQNFSETIVDV
jgi:hypothetical protein